MPDNIHDTAMPEERPLKPIDPDHAWLIDPRKHSRYCHVYRAVLDGTSLAKLDAILTNTSPEHRLNALGLYLQSVAMAQDTARRTADQEAKHV